MPKPENELKYFFIKNKSIFLLRMRLESVSKDHVKHPSESETMILNR